MKLTELKGKENLPEKIYLESTTVLEKVSVNSRNITIDQYNQLEIDGDVEALTKIIEKAKWTVASNMFHKVAVDNNKVIADAVISNLSKFLVVKKG